MNDSVIVAIRALLVMVFLGALLGQTVLVPAYASAAATVLVLSLGVHLLGGATVCGTAFVLPMLVMRRLLHNAAIMEEELEGLYGAN